MPQHSAEFHSTRVQYFHNHSNSSSRRGLQGFRQWLELDMYVYACVYIHMYVCIYVFTDSVLIGDAALITNTKSVRSIESIVNRAWIARTGKLNFDFFVSVSMTPFELNSLLWFFCLFFLPSDFVCFLLGAFGHAGACGVISKMLLRRPIRMRLEKKSYGRARPSFGLIRNPSKSVLISWELTYT